jgi:hypothetical protein
MAARIIESRARRRTVAKCRARAESKRLVRSCETPARDDRRQLGPDDPGTRIALAKAGAEASPTSGKELLEHGPRRLLVGFLGHRGSYLAGRLATAQLTSRPRPPCARRRLGRRAARSVRHVERILLGARVAVMPPRRRDRQPKRAADAGIEEEAEEVEDVERALSSRPPRAPPTPRRSRRAAGVPRAPTEQPVVTTDREPVLGRVFCPGHFRDPCSMSSRHQRVAARRRH